MFKPAPVEIERREKRAGRETAYKKASAAARKRDGARCRLCGDHRNLESHHVVPRSLVGKAQRDSVANLITLCAECHQDVTRHVVKLYPGPDGANGLVRVEKYSKAEGGYVVVREAA
jgi:5-methylcytosine-specific restriction endonuclease McrA